MTDRDRPSRPDEGEQFDEAERRALDVWSAPEAPDDLAARLMAQLDSEGSDVAEAGQRAWLPRAAHLALAASVVLCVGAVLVLWRPGSAAAGDVVAEQRVTVTLRDRGVAVAEAGSELSWQVQASGAARVKQVRGNVFYRVEHGGPFMVETPRGTVTVRGTCFRVEVRQMRSSKAGLIGAATGAAAATLVLVSVYEGKVLTASPRGEVELAAGQAAELSDEAPRKLAEPPAVGAKTSGGATAAAPSMTSKATATVPALQAQNQALTRERTKLRGELEAMQQQVAALSKKARKGRVYDLNKEELAQLAERCELRWDTPNYDRSDPPDLSPKKAEDAGLTPEERDAANKVLAAQHRTLREQLRAIYVSVTGDKKGADDLSPSAMEREVLDKSRSDDMRRAFRVIARERAGLQAPPADLSKRPAVERMTRIITGAGDRTEKAMGDVIGPDLAKRLRARDSGFGSKSRSSYGCPK